MGRGNRDRFDIQRPHHFPHRKLASGFYPVRGRELLFRHDLWRVSSSHIARNHGFDRGRSTREAATRAVPLLRAKRSALPPNAAQGTPGRLCNRSQRKKGLSLPEEIKEAEAIAEPIFFWA